MIQLSSRLQSCADLVRRGNPAVDVGTDHGYLAIYLLQQGICPKVCAADLREGPLEAARRSARRENVRENISFVLSDGLHNINIDEIRTVICAGMGGDNIIGILEAAPEVRDPGLQLVLQPQSKAPELRRYLAERGFSLRQERISRDGKFLYTAMEAGWTGDSRILAPGEDWLSQALLQSGDPLGPDYISRMIQSVSMSVNGLHKASNPDPALLEYYQKVLEYLREREEKL